MAHPPAALRPIIALIVLTILGLLAWRNGWLYDPHVPADPTHIRLTGSVEVTRIDLAPRVGGRVISRYAEGVQVDAGTPVVILTSPTLEQQRAVLVAQVAQADATLRDLANGARPSEIAQARAGVKAAQQRVRLLEAGSRPQEVQAAQAQVAVALDAVDQARENVERAERLYDDGVIPRKERDDARHALQRAQEQLRIAKEQASLVAAGPRAQEIAIAKAQAEGSQASLDLLEEGATPETLERARATVAAVEAQLAAVDADLAELAITAPIAGVVDRLLVEDGELVSPGQRVATLRAVAETTITAYLPEPDLPLVRIGQEVAILVPNATALTGTIATIASEAEFTPRNIQTPEDRATQVFAVEIRVTDPPEYLRDGMTLEVVIDKVPPTGTPQ